MNRKSTQTIVILIVLIITSLACGISSSPTQAPPITQVIQVTQIIPVVQATESVSCEKVDGMYQRSTDKLVMTIAQTGCKIIGTSNASAYDHTIEGNWVSDGYYYVTVKRHNNTDGCVTEMFGKMSKLQNGNIQFLINGTDGRCDLLPSYSEDSVWTRQ